MTRPITENRFHFSAALCLRKQASSSCHCKYAFVLCHSVLMRVMSFDVMTDLDSIYRPLLCSLQFLQEFGHTIAEQQFKLNLVNNKTFLSPSVKMTLRSIDSHTFFTDCTSLFLSLIPVFFFYYRNMLTCLNVFIYCSGVWFLEALTLEVIKTAAGSSLSQRGENIL